MSMEDIMKALMQSAAAQQQPPPSGGADAMSQMLGEVLGGGQSQAGTGGDAMSQALGGLLAGGQQQGAVGGDMLTQALGALVGGGQTTGSAGTGALLGGLQQILGGTPGSGQQLPLGGGGATLGTGNPLMLLLQPVVNKLAAKLGISPQMATMIASIALHYLVQSSPRTPGASPLDLGGVMGSLTSGKGISPTTLQRSGMVTDVVNATGLTEQQAVRGINTAFGLMSSPLAPSKSTRARKAPTRTKKTSKTGRSVKGTATLKRRAR